MIRNEIADFLEAAVISPVVFSFYDSAPDECVALFPYPGGPPVHTKDRSGAVMEIQRVQVVARGGEEGAETLAWRAYRVLDGLGGAKLGTAFYASVRALQSPFRDQGGADEVGRVKFIFNVEAKKQPTTV